MISLSLLVHIILLCIFTDLQSSYCHYDFFQDDGNNYVVHYYEGKDCSGKHHKHKHHGYPNGKHEQWDDSYDCKSYKVDRRDQNPGFFVTLTCIGALHG